MDHLGDPSLVGRGGHRARRRRRPGRLYVRSKRPGSGEHRDRIGPEGQQRGAHPHEQHRSVGLAGSDPRSAGRRGRISRSAFAGSYLARTYQETATAWTSRLSPLATARLVAELRAGVASPAQWAALVAARTIVRVVVNSAAVATGFHGTDNLRLVEVGYVSTTQTSAGMSAPVSTSLRVMLSLVDGQWRADHLIPVTQ